MRTQRKKNIGLIAIIVGVGMWLVVAAGVVGYHLARQQPGQQGPAQPAVDGNTVVSSEEKDLAELVRKVSPSVVSIVTTKESEGYRRRRSQSAGTGMIISKDGYVLTNKHVVEGARHIAIIMSDGTSHSDVAFVGADPLNDVAFLKIKNVNNVPPVSFGDSGTVRVGQKVVAIGNSLGQYQNTVTSGIISGKGRPVQAAVEGGHGEVEQLTDLLQTDAAINHGNSGGPLLNSSGQVVGINTAIVSDAQSVGFAIPINATKGLVKGVLESGRIQKSYLGVRYIAITPEVRAEKKLTVRQGALVDGDDDGLIDKDGPAAKAGIRRGDVIVKVNDKHVGEQGGLGSLVAEYAPGQKVTLTVLRDGKETQLELTLASYAS